MTHISSEGKAVVDAYIIRIFDYVDLLHIVHVRVLQRESFVLVGISPTSKVRTGWACGLWTVSGRGLMDPPSTSQSMRYRGVPPEEPVTSVCCCTPAAI